MDELFDFVTRNPMAAVIVAGETGFWVLIVAGLVARYVFRLRRTGLVLLAATPVIDLGVLIAAVIDLAGGAEASWVHGVAAVYLGFSVVFGPSMIRWADDRFARWFLGRATERPRLSHSEKLRKEWRDWGRCLLASALAAAVMGVLILVAGSLEQTRQLWGADGWLIRLAVISGIWFVGGPVWQALTPRRAEVSHNNEKG
ncbi:hypothetical protein SAMN05216266_11265 [Amycolatopsis marina]|uniref:Uncharacterized protein n=1 Tax=Amycolatopsis marina TaxID=490629 RepID=A0A1I1B5A7_9PSEU|nr:hypothetical protein [Amycolatopsis marina]SFB45549.1 hypothetical protein SAMN05216266_11265 [Amycolatopsis marina]